MRGIPDCFGNSVRLTDERLPHILEHPEMGGLVEAIDPTLLKPELVRQSRSDATVRLFYTHHDHTVVGSKYLCVVVKYSVAGAFVVTAYLTDKPNGGDDLWPRK